MLLQLIWMTQQMAATLAVPMHMGSGSVWTEQGKLTASDGANSDEFGRSVAIYGDTIVIGAYWHNIRHDAAISVDSGSAYVYTRYGMVWTEEATLVASDGAANSYFGSSVTIN